jgi:hypothetical protein
VRTDLFVYLSGPMTAKDGFLMEENVAAGLRVHLDLLRLGIPNFCPQLSGAFPSAWADVSYDRWIAFDFAVIDRCTHVLTPDRWESSKGAVMEKEYAEVSGKAIVYSIEELKAAA